MSTHASSRITHSKIWALETKRHKHVSQSQYSLQVQERANKLVVGIDRTNFNKQQNIGFIQSSQRQKYGFRVD